MRFRCKFAISGDAAESQLFEWLRQRLENHLYHELSFVETFEVLGYDYGDMHIGESRINVTLKLETSNNATEVETLMDIFIWTNDIIQIANNEEGFLVGIDELTAQGERVEITDLYHVPQQVTVI